MSIKVTGQGVASVSKFLEQMEKQKLSVGWFEGMKYTDNTPVAYVAATQEYGSEKKNIPPRPFMRPAMYNNHNQWMGLFKQLADDIISGSLSAEGALDIIGSTVTEDIKDAITQVKEPELKESTIANRVRRGLNTTDLLRATGTMISSVTWVVE